MSPARTTVVSGSATGGWISDWAARGTTSTDAVALAWPLLTVYSKVCGSSIPAGAVTRSSEWRTTSTFRPSDEPMDTPWMTSTPPAGSKSLTSGSTTTTPVADMSARSFSAAGCSEAPSGSVTSTRILPLLLFGPSLME